MRFLAKFWPIRAGVETCITRSMNITSLLRVLTDTGHYGRAEDADSSTLTRTQSENEGKRYRETHEISFVP